jgi:hypothetical protein
MKASLVAEALYFKKIFSIIMLLRLSFNIDFVIIRSGKLDVFLYKAIITIDKKAANGTSFKGRLASL